MTSELYTSQVEKIKKKVEGNPNIGAHSEKLQVNQSFTSIWAHYELERVRFILKRTMQAATAKGIKLYLDCGTLLGYVRERRILPWDDDIDLILVGEENIAVLVPALKLTGLSVLAPPSWKGTGIKIFDPHYGPIISDEYRYTWPNLDIFILFERDGRLDHRFLGQESLDYNLFVPGSHVVFETVHCWIPEKPSEILDIYYKDWRTVERSNHLNHRKETTIENIYERNIKTDITGRKIVDYNISI